MNKKRFATAFLVIMLILAMSPAVAFAKGKPPVETTNNLSFPAIWSEGTSLNLAGNMLEASLNVPYSIDPNPCGEGAFAYAQKTEGNVWQAESLKVTSVEDVIVNEIDWGDSLESVDMKVGRPVRVELTLYKTLETKMTGFTMVMLANPSSPDEVQGACATTNPGDIGMAITYLSSEATVYSPYGKLVFQKISGINLTWDDNQWTGDAETPVNVSFAGELNVGGKVIYGLSTGGWKPTELGDYRITFYLPTDKNTKFDEDTTIRLSTETEAVVTAEEGGDVGGEAFVIPEHNLTYIDITVVGGGGGGKK